MNLEQESVLHAHGDAKVEKLLATEGGKHYIKIQLASVCNVGEGVHTFFTQFISPILIKSG